MVYGQTEITKDLMDGRAAAGAPTIYAADDVNLHDLFGDKPHVTYRTNGKVRRDRLRLHRRLRRLSRRQPQEPAAERVRRPMRGSIRSAGSAFCPRRRLCPTSSSTSSTRWLRALLDALADAQPLLYPVQPRRGRRCLAGRAFLGGTQAPARRGGPAIGLSPGRRSKRASRRCAASSPSRCASAGCSSPAMPPISCRRPAPRASIWRRATYATSQRALVEALCREIRRRPRTLFRSRAGAGVEGRALLMVDDHAAAPDFRKSFRSQNSARRTGLSVPLDGGRDGICRELCGAAVLDLTEMSCARSRAALDRSSAAERTPAGWVKIRRRAMPPLNFRKKISARSLGTFGLSCWSVVGGYPCRRYRAVTDCAGDGPRNLRLPEGARTTNGS